MMIRLSEEFNFNVAAFHHALEAWRVADFLGARKIGAAIFADHWGYKKEVCHPFIIDTTIGLWNKCSRS
jgi:hypothetical protein